MRRGRPKGSTKQYFHTTELGAIEDMSTPDRPLTSFNVYRATGNKLRPYKFIKSCYKAATALLLLRDIEPVGAIPKNFIK